MLGKGFTGKQTIRIVRGIYTCSLVTSLVHIHRRDDVCFVHYHGKTQPSAWFPALHARRSHHGMSRISIAGHTLYQCCPICMYYSIYTLSFEVRKRSRATATHLRREPGLRYQLIILLINFL